MEYSFIGQDRKVRKEENKKEQQQQKPKQDLKNVPGNVQQMKIPKWPLEFIP